MLHLVRASLMWIGMLSGRWFTCMRLVVAAWGSGYSVSLIVVALAPAHVSCLWAASALCSLGEWLWEWPCRLRCGGVSLLYLLRAGHELTAWWPPSSPPHRPGTCGAFHLFVSSVYIAVCWWAVVHNDTAAHIFVVLVPLSCWSWTCGYGPRQWH
jgi:hypothetical protein